MSQMDIKKEEEDIVGSPSLLMEHEGPGLHKLGSWSELEQ